MGLNLDYTTGQTPLDEEEKDGLRIDTITTRGDLDEFEQYNIEQAIQWSMSAAIRADAVVTERFICDVHQRMYGDVWRWAGAFRRSEKNIGIPHWQIPTALRQLCDDTQYWIAQKTYPPDEVAVRFKYRIVSIHCFPNGNGRHSRLMPDIISERIFKQPVFTWGGGQLVQASDIRAAYLAALKKADQGDIAPLLTFARS